MSGMEVTGGEAMKRSRRGSGPLRSAVFGVCAAGVLAALATTSCGGKAIPPGELVLTIQTDMALPKDVDMIRVEVSSYGAVQFSGDYPVGAGKLLVPATLGLLAPQGASKPYTIRVTARKAGKPRMLREVVTTIPTDRTAMLRVPIQWLCDGSAKETQSGEVESSCPGGQTCTVAGCVDWNVDAASLPGYEPAEVFGGGAQAGEGACFDTVPCMTGGTELKPDAQCMIDLPAGGQGVNVALRPSNSDGICDASNANCFVPLDRSEEMGWAEAGGRIRLPKAVCDQIASGRVKSVVASTTCATKTPRSPTCGPWSSVGSSDECFVQGSLAGTWSGTCGSMSVKGTFTMTIADGCRVTGSYSGSDSGSLSGSVGSTGSLSAASGEGGGGIKWGGSITRSGGVLNGTGTWAGNNLLAGYCSGTWTGVGAEMPADAGADARSDGAAEAGKDSSADGVPPTACNPPCSAPLICCISLMGDPSLCLPESCPAGYVPQDAGAGGMGASGGSGGTGGAKDSGAQPPG
jgi:hypothetical protein